MNAAKWGLVRDAVCGRLSGLWDSLAVKCGEMVLLETDGAACRSGSKVAEHIQLLH